MATAGAAVIALGIAGTAQAESVVIGGPGEPGGDCAPFGCTLRYQQVYNASLFSSPIQIDTISFFNKNDSPGSISNANYTINLSTTNKAVNGLSNIFASNIGANNQSFFVGSLSGAISDGKFSITGNSFLYDPSQGNLLLDVSKDGGSYDFSAFLDYNPSSNGSFSRLFSFDNSSSGNIHDNYGLVTEFSSASKSVPEPASLMGILGLGAFGVTSLRKRKQVSAVKA
ncbi:PEP-CTERM sorting domain-containing protein [Anabaena sp. UHCC 0187]|uniref:PEP-CTERM sorting domain-containing protein n=1 Tax=Anabaena sp. UHCC 0187 TaxID=2590018 RepID=UPI001C2B82F5|nr:PEP-CTERM sorting domain-containing protein [Anabaena sp. UHCC 0187]